MRGRLIVFCLVISSAMLCQGADQPPALSGQWEGAVEIPGYELRVVIDLAQKDQEWVGSLTAPQFGTKGASIKGKLISD